ncbi:MAG: hypothetical protein ACFFER_14125 [Candidatus Thorarchaeota archaeon]
MEVEGDGVSLTYIGRGSPPMLSGNLLFQREIKTREHTYLGWIFQNSILA